MTTYVGFGSPYDTGPRGDGGRKDAKAKGVSCRSIQFSMLRARRPGDGFLSSACVAAGLAAPDQILRH